MMKSGYFIPITNNFKLLWIWWVILLAFQQIIYYELNAKSNIFLNIWLILMGLGLAYLLIPRRFLYVERTLYLVRNFKLKTAAFDLDHLEAVKFNRYRISFIHNNVSHSYFVIGKSNLFMKSILEDAQIESNQPLLHQPPAIESEEI